MTREIIRNRDAQCNTGKWPWCESKHMITETRISAQAHQSQPLAKYPTQATNFWKTDLVITEGTFDILTCSFV